ncbi:LysR family transcriptional regulator [Lichenicoccus sp.]|uniref:LysR family transcriptional regulator n=1 Tax=Lichenicoccus sp. TaxID=2781899 RepID=UPI003D0B96CE
MNRRIDLNDIRLLMQVVEHGSYTAAARAIGVPKSTISQRIANLEATIGTGLLRRTSRSFSLTNAGAQLLPHARAIEDVVRQVEHALVDHDGELQGTLRVSASHAIAQFALSPLVPQFLAEHAQVTIKVEASNRLIDLVGEGFDMTVRGHVGPLKDSILIQRVVARTPWTLAASPAWVAARKLPEAPIDLPMSETLCFSNTPDAQVWLLMKGEVEQRLTIKPRLISDDMLSVRNSTIAGAGIACLPVYVFSPAFDTGELVRLLPDWSAQTSCISVLTPPKAQSSRLAATFSNFLAAHLPAIVQR